MSSPLEQCIEEFIISELERQKQALFGWQLIRRYTQHCGHQKIDRSAVLNVLQRLADDEIVTSIFAGTPQRKQDYAEGLYLIPHDS